MAHLTRETVRLVVKSQNGELVHYSEVFNPERSGEAYLFSATETVGGPAMDRQRLAELLLADKRLTLSNSDGREGYISERGASLTFVFDDYDYLVCDIVWDDRT